MNDLVVPFPKFGAGVGLHRVAAIAERMEIDLAGFGARSCVITGSNGKGSVAAMTASMLAATGARVGRFTSPHLLTIRERFALNGDDIAPAELEMHWSRALAAARACEQDNPDDKVGGFEFLFLVAASWFSAQRCGHVVWEAGIGGRYDPTRLIRAQHGALVSLDLEHMALLGDTLEQIAYNKLDAFPENAKVLLGENTRPLVLRIDAYARLRRLNTEYVGWRDDDVRLVLGDITALPPLAGPHQRNNTALAVRLARAMRPALTRAQIDDGLARTVWPGRLETISTAPPIVIDVGHTPDAIAAARAGFEAMHAPAVLVCGASVDKPADEIIAALAPGFRVIICAAARHKGSTAAEIAALARAGAPSAEVMTAGSVTEAYHLARARAGGGAIYVAGGLFLAAEFRAVHLGADPAALHFF